MSKNMIENYLGQFYLMQNPDPPFKKENKVPVEPKQYVEEQKK